MNLHPSGGSYDGLATQYAGQLSVKALLPLQPLSMSYHPVRMSPTSIQNQHGHHFHSQPSSTFSSPAADSQVAMAEKRFVTSSSPPRSHVHSAKERLGDGSKTVQSNGERSHDRLGDHVDASSFCSKQQEPSSSIAETLVSTNEQRHDDASNDLKSSFPMASICTPIQAETGIREHRDPQDAVDGKREEVDDGRRRVLSESDEFGAGSGGVDVSEAFRKCDEATRQTDFSLSSPSYKSEVVSLSRGESAYFAFLPLLFCVAVCLWF